MRLSVFKRLSSHKQERMTVRFCVTSRAAYRAKSHPPPHPPVFAVQIALDFPEQENQTLRSRQIALYRIGSSSPPSSPDGATVSRPHGHARHAVTARLYKQCQEARRFDAVAVTIKSQTQNKPSCVTTELIANFNFLKIILNINIRAHNCAFHAPTFH